MWTMGAPLWGGETDPYFSGVILLMRFDGDYTDKSTLAQSFTNTGATLSSAGAKFTQSATINGTNPGGGGGNNVKSSAARSEYDLNSGDFTIECWAKPASAALSGGSVRPLVALNPSGSSGAVLGVRGDATGTLAVFGYEIGGGANSFNSTGVYLTSNVWYHLAGTRSGNTYRLFVDGALVNSAIDASRGAVSSKKATIGNFDGLSLAFDGSIDEVRVTKGVARYTSAFTAPVAPFPSA